jgi:hypothetical protein
MAKVPKREFMRRGINQHTLEKICRREPVRAVKLEECLKALEGYERSSVGPLTRSAQLARCSEGLRAAPSPLPPWRAPATSANRS